MRWRRGDDEAYQRFSDLARDRIAAEDADVEEWNARMATLTCVQRWDAYLQANPDIGMGRDTAIRWVERGLGPRPADI
jgi:hypothetical protein